MKASEFDQRFDAGEDISSEVNWKKARRRGTGRKRKQANIDLGKRVLYVRKDILGFPRQEDFAEHLGVTRGAVGNWEVGVGMKFAHLLQIVEEFDISLEWLARGKGIPKTKPGIDSQLEQFPPEECEALHEDIQALIDNRRRRLESKP